MLEKREDNVNHFYINAILCIWNEICSIFVELYNNNKMAKPIKITPVLKGQDAVNFHRNLKTSNAVKVSKDVLHAIREDADKLKSLFKHRK